MSDALKACNVTKPALFLILLVTLISWNTARAQLDEPPSPDSLILTDGQGEYPLGLNLDILEDPSGKLTIEEVASPEFESQFEASQVDVPNYGFTDSAYWVRLPLRNESTLTDRWLLELGFANMHYVDLYSPLSDSKGFGVKQTGILRPSASRDLREPRIVFDLTVPPHDQQIYYLRLQSDASMTFPLTLWMPDTFGTHSKQLHMVGGLFFGALFVLLAYNLFLLLSLREKSYLFLILFLASVIVFEATYAGYAAAYLMQNTPVLGLYGYTISFSLMFVFMILFADSFLELAQRLPRLHWLSMVITVIWALLLLLIPLERYDRFTVLATRGALLSMATVLAIGVIAWLRGVPNTRFFLVAWIGLFITFSVTILDRMGMFSSTPLNDEIYHMGLLWMGICWSLALADRINLLKEDVERSERRLSQILEGLPIGVVVYGADARPTYLNRRVMEILSNPTKNIFPNIRVGRTLTQAAEYFSFRLAGTEERYPMAEMPITLALQGESASADNIEVDLQSRRVPLEIWASPVTDSDARVESAVVAFQDISQRRAAEAELAEYRHRLENLVEQRTVELNDEIAERKSLAELQFELIEWLSFINHAHETLKSSADLPQAYENLLVTIGELLGAKSAFIGLWDNRLEQINVLCWAQTDDPPGKIKQFSIPLEEDSSLLLEIERGEFTILPADQIQQRFSTLAACLQDAEIQSVALAPVQTQQFVSGLFGLGLPRTVEEFPDQRATLIKRVALDMASFAQQAHLLDQAHTLVVVEERQRLARDLHDSVTQTLFTSSILAEATPILWTKNQDLARQNMEQLSTLIRGALAEMRSLLLELRADAMPEQTLEQLIITLAEATRARSKVMVAINTENIGEPPGNVPLMLYRIAQEGLNNVLKHADAATIDISLRSDLDCAALTIQDDGCGFDPHNIPAGHMGLGIMAERANEIGADLESQSHVGHGTKIIVNWASLKGNNHD